MSLSRFRLSFILIFTLFSTLISLAQTPGEKAYASGAAAFKAGQWTQAEKFFKQSYGSYVHPMTAYYLSLTYMNLNQKPPALEYANKALGDAARLKTVYYNGAKMIVKWATTTATVEADTSGRADTVAAGGPPVPSESVIQEESINLRTDVAYSIVASHSSFCLDVWSGSNDDLAVLVQYPCHFGQNQLFSLQKVGGNLYHLIAQHSGKCLDVTGGSLEDRAALIQYGCHGGDNQVFEISKISPERFQIKAKHSGKCLDVLGASVDSGIAVIQFTCHGGPNQLWTFAPK